MPNGDIALAAGMIPVDPSTDLVKDGYDQINYALDQIAERTNDVTPVAEGGTGATNAAGARTNLAITPANIGARPAGNVPWGEVSGKPGTYPPDSHGHSADQITVPGWSGVLTTNIKDINDGYMSTAIYDRNITWTRRGVWVGDNGHLGWASSRRDAKQDFETPEWTIEQMCQVPILHYRYRAAVAAQQAGKIERAATEIGSIADDLHDLGLWEFVIYEGRGEDAVPMGIHYELLSLAALWLGQRLANMYLELAANQADLAARVSALENPS